MKYKEFLHEYEILGQMKLVEPHDLSPHQPRVSYLPHHGIWQTADRSTKLCVVFNASCHVGGKPSLNDCLHAGPPLQSDLSIIICRWRLHHVAGTDIGKMYRQIRVHPSDSDLQRIIWQSPDGRERHFQLLTVTCGLNCAPYLALRVLRQLAQDEANRFPRDTQIMENAPYVDDILFAADDVTVAQQLRDELIGLLAAGGFSVRKWMTSHPQVLDGFPDRVHLRPRWKDISPDEPIKTLGLAWDPSTDEFCYQVPQPTNPTVLTKRSTLSLIARFFHPLGWVSPSIVVAKILMQDMWRHKKDWDDEPPTMILTRWQRFVASLPEISHIKIPRWIQTLSSCGLELHGFADASQTAYGAVVYALITNESGQRTVQLLAAKTKVAPVKIQTILRLELSAAVLLGRLLHMLRTAYGDRVTSLNAWTDSTITIVWIQSGTSRKDIFVANRVSQIQQMLPGLSWRHLLSEDNPADLASRGIDMAGLASAPRWWRGPSWLSQSRDAWSSQVVPPCSERIQEIHSTCLVTTPRGDAAFIDRFSKLDRLLRVIARCLRFPLLIRPEGRDVMTKPITATDLENAFLVCTRLIQGLTFREEITALQRGHSLGPRDRLAPSPPS